MNARKMAMFKDDEEFRFLIYPVGRQQSDSLQRSILKHGCLDPILVWKDTIIDGRKRYQICMEHGISFTVRQINFMNRHQAMSWICQNQLKRKDLSGKMQAYLVGKYFKEEKLSSESLDNERHTCKRKHAKDISEEFHLAESTIYDYSAYSVCIDSLSRKNKDVAKAILTEKLKISFENTIIISKADPQKLKALASICSQNDVVHYKNLQQKDENSHEQVNIKIKEAPAYDPDAEISSLTLTIPSWISSIERTKNTDLKNISDAGREKLFHELTHLRSAVFSMQETLKEKRNG